MKIGLGTAAIGRPEYINIRQESKSKFDLETFKQQGIEVLNHAYENGVRYYDTAPGYGLAEQLLIDWAKGKSDIDLATKWGYTYVANFDPNALQHEIKEHSLEKLVEQWKLSSQLLPQLSTYQIHSATLETGVLENKAVLEQLAVLKKEANLHVGITTTGDNQLEVLKRALDVQVDGEDLFSAFQVTYNMLDQSLGEIIPEIQNAGKRVIVKEALANGRLFQNANYAHYQSKYVKLASLAKKYGVGQDAIALQFVIATANPFSVLSGGSVAQHISDNIKALDFKLEESEIEELKSCSISPVSYWKERKALGWQ